jgi:uncharacterized RDD family membrane protein YckC
MTQQPPPPPGPEDGPYAGPPASPYQPPPSPSGYGPPPASGYGYPPAQGYAYPPPPQDQRQAYQPYAGPPQPYAGPAYGPSGYSPYATEYYAHWGRRVGAYLLDYVLILPGWVLAVIGLALTSASTGSRTRASSGGSTVGVVLALVGYALMLGLTIWNRYFRAGRTGQSWGKKVVGIRLVRESDLRPIGAGMAFVRDLAHIVDGFFYLGYLWPLWDPKRQTFADKICSTVVLAT